MVWLEDPLTGDVPHRGIVEEEDEEQAAELAPQYAVAPAVEWAPGQAAVEGATVVFLAGQAACLLAGAVLRQAQTVGSIAVPELVRVRSPLEEEFGTGHQPVHTCSLHALGSGLLLVLSPRDLPAEQAPVWARAVLAALQPRALVVAATLPAMNYRGPGDPADEDLVFSLQTEAAAAAGAAGGAAGAAAGLPPPLPEGTMLGGLPAALLARAELQQLPATLVAGVQVQQVPDAQFLLALGQGLSAALRSTAPAAEAALVQQPRGATLAALGAAADAVYRSSASSSIFS
ncbi:fatty acid desaturase [Chlorella sorokiniana]|uniref:Fatty acid desaturase n=1 Tax=Chlorella sorokiniana TaxID=3076 RepID=A0A2P6TLP0_CHLSO|nr:fatty acid desaturase [Chlorella sorokiniana]|eukprot:PRW45200.1 fatty acid desaturase [Chlorella sorokiniana]